MKKHKKKIIKMLKRKIIIRKKMRPFFSEESVKRTFNIPWVRELMEELKDM